MRSLWLSLLVIITLLCPQLRGSTDRVLIIVNANNPVVLSEAQIRNIYSDRMSRWPNGSRTHLYELPARSLIRERFYQQLLGVTAQRSEALWNNRKITNTLKSLPPKTRRESTLISAVARDRHAIGYVSENAFLGSNQNVRVVHSLD